MSKKILLNKATIAVLEPGKYYDLKERGLLLPSEKTDVLAGITTVGKTTGHTKKRLAGIPT